MWLSGPSIRHGLLVMKKFICKLFGHFMYFDSVDVAGPATCRVCGYKEPGIMWPKPPSRKSI